MKKNICTLILGMICSSSINAQLEGFYHFKNTTSGRYISINDTDPGNYNVNLATQSVNLKGIATYLDYDTVAVSPSCVIFIRDLGGGLSDMVAQGSSLVTMTGNQLDITITGSGEGPYVIQGKTVAKGMTVTRTLSEMKRQKDKPDNYVSDSYLTTTATSPSSYINWYALPINTSDEWIGIRPDVKTGDGTYYGTMYFGFCFRLASPGMAAYYVSNVSGNNFTLKEITDDIIPANVPVVIRCNSADPKDNKILPVIGAYEFNKTNWLEGVFCATTEYSTNKNATIYDLATMRVIGLNENGKLAFVKAKAENLYKNIYLRANKAYLKVGADAADVLSEGTTAINTVKSNMATDNSIYTLTGTRIPDGTTPRAGIYIKNGQKIIIK